MLTFLVFIVSIYYILPCIDLVDVCTIGIACSQYKIIILVSCIQGRPEPLNLPIILF